jgi:hypothetical protein
MAKSSPASGSLLVQMPRKQTHMRSSDLSQIDSELMGLIKMDKPQINFYDDDEVLY